MPCRPEDTPAGWGRTRRYRRLRGGWQGCQQRALDFPAAAPPLNIRGMTMTQIILLIALIALIAFWFFMRKKGA